MNNNWWGPTVCAHVKDAHVKDKIITKAWGYQRHTQLMSTR